MTLNQTVARIKSICEAHQQINTFFAGREDEFFALDRVFAAACLEFPDNEAIQRGATILPMRLYFFDRVVQGGATSDNSYNEQEVISDMREVALDIFSQMRFQNFDPIWNVREDANIGAYMYEAGEDYLAGVILDFSIKNPFSADRCAVPSNFAYNV
jgi:hypothetical protein